MIFPCSAYLSALYSMGSLWKGMRYKYLKGCLFRKTISKKFANHIIVINFRKQKNLTNN